MINKVILTGRLVEDPELQQTGNGVDYARFTLAVDRNYRNQDGEQDTDFVNIITWRKQAQNCVKYLGKGRLVGVDGCLRINRASSNGQTRTFSQVEANRIEFLDWPRDQD
ncbi:MAG: single-stranded DNA-binding protein [Bacillota bacterium]